MRKRNILSYRYIECKRIFSYYQEGFDRRFDKQYDGQLNAFNLADDLIETYLLILQLREKGVIIPNS